MLKLIAKLFGTKSQKDIKRIMPLVEQTKEEGEKLKPLSHNQLREETRKIQQTIEQELSEIDSRLATLHKQIADNPNLDLSHKESIFAEIDKTEVARNKELEKVLLTVLPKAFAIVRETARRFKENQFIEVNAQPSDIAFAAKYSHVQIKDDKAVWANQWLAAG